MTTSEQENTTGGSSGVQEQKGNGIAGPSQEVSQRDQMASCTACAGQEMSELEWARRHVIDEPVPRLVQRKTEIIGCGVPAGNKRALYLREKTENISIDLPPEMLENNGDLIFLLLDHMHRIEERQNRKIERLQRQLSEVEELGGSR